VEALMPHDRVHRSDQAESSRADRAAVDTSQPSGDVASLSPRGLIAERSSPNVDGDLIPVHPDTR
jgi:hypothetical protein